MDVFERDDNSRIRPTIKATPKLKRETNIPNVSCRYDKKPAFQIQS